MRSILNGSSIRYSYSLSLLATEELRNLLTGVEGIPCFVNIGAKSSILIGPLGV
jgi:hypothetical protein